MVTGAELIARERQRQVDTEGWSAEHDDTHKTGEMALAARCYAQTAYLQVLGWSAGGPERTWPWNKQSWKLADDPIRNLVKSGALIAAEIDRLLRLATVEAALARSNQPITKAAWSAIVVNTPTVRDGEPLGTEEFYRAVANALVQSRAKGVDDGK